MKRRRLGVLAAAVYLFSCGGTPTPPSTTESITGTYTGSVTYRQAAPDTHCYAQFLHSLPAGHGYATTVEIRQDGQRVEGTLRGTHIRTTCSFQGQIGSSGSLSWQQTTCGEPCTTFRDGTCAAQRICVAAHSFEGQKTATGLRGNHRVTWDVFDVTTGEAAGRLEITGALQADR